MAQKILPKFFQGNERYKQVYTIGDHNNLPLKGTLNDPESSYVRIAFFPCNSSSFTGECAEESELKHFLANHRILLLAVNNYINLGEIAPVEETL